MSPEDTTTPVTGTAARRARQQAAREAATREAGQRRHERRRDDREEDTETVAPAPPRRTLDPDVLAALEEERDFLLRSLDDLEREHDAGDVDDHDYETLKDDYTARAASALRAIDAREAQLASHRRPRRRGRSLAIGAVVLLGACGLGVFVARSSGTRGAGDTVSGNIRQSSRDQLIQAQNLMGQGKLSDALKAYEQVLQEDPANAQALAYKGYLLFLTARQVSTANDRDVLLKSALDSLDLAVKADPSYPDGHIFRAIVLDDLGQDPAALTELDQVSPSAIPADMTGLVTQFRQKLQSSAAGTTVAGTVP